MSIEVLTPDGRVGPAPVQPARSPAVLAGAGLAVLDNGKPNARLLLVRAAEQLADRTGATLRLVTGKGPGRNAATACADLVLDGIAEEVELVLTGSAD